MGLGVMDGGCVFLCVFSYVCFLRVFCSEFCVWGLDHVGGVGIGLLRTLLGNLECVGGWLDRCRKEDYRVGKYWWGNVVRMGEIKDYCNVCVLM